MVVESRRYRRSIRLKGYDYSGAGVYFVTICTRNRECLFNDLQMREVVERAWLWLSDRYSYIDLDEYVVMPNHIHGILIIGRGGSRTAPREKRKPLGGLIGAFKTVSTKQINQLRGTPAEMVWQRNYYEHVIRNENELNRIREYIQLNPLKWELDRENPHRKETDTHERQIWNWLGGGEVPKNGD